MDNNSFAVGYVLGWKRGSDSGGGSPSIKDDTFDDIIANKTEIATLWQDNTFKITLNVWYNEEFRGGARDFSYIANSYYFSGSPRSSFYVRTHNFFCVLIVYKNSVPQYVVLLNSSYDNTNTPIPIFTYTDTYSSTSNNGHTYWYQAVRADFSATRWVFDPCTGFEFTTSNNGMWDGCMKFKTKGTATYASYRRSVSWSGDTPVLQDWQRDPDVTVSTYSDLDYTRSNAKLANLILPSYSRFTKLTHDDYQTLMNELIYAVNSSLGITVEMPNIIT